MTSIEISKDEFEKYFCLDCKVSKLTKFQLKNIFP